MPHFYEFNSVLTGDQTLQVLCSTVALVSLAAPVSLATPVGAPETTFRTDSLNRLQDSADRLGDRSFVLKPATG